MAAVAVLTFGLGTAAHADVIVSYVGFVANPVDVEQINAPIDTGAYVGEFALTTNHGQVNAWCVDLYHDISTGPQSPPIDYQTITGLTTDNNGNALTQTQINEMSWLIVDGSNIMDHGGTPDQSAAIQLAIWSLEYAGFSFTGSSANVDTLEAAYYAGALLQANNTSDDNAVVQLHSLAGVQGLVTFVPEPDSLALLGAALVALAGSFAFRRQRRQNA
jgi:hypothetical protein